jgi:hypothetical protein
MKLLMPAAKAISVLSVMLLFLATADRGAAALLNGTTMGVALDYQATGQPADIVTSGPLTVGPGVELVDFGRKEIPFNTPALVDIDISDTQILLTLVIDQPSTNIMEFQIGAVGAAFFPAITNATVNPATNWAGFTSDQLVFSTRSVFVNTSGLAGLEGQQILVDVVPEPAAAGLAAAASPALLAVHRRRRRA